MNSDPNAATPPLLEARQLAAGYHGHHVVSQIDLHLSAGEVVGLLGANGAGKTTILLALAGVLRPLHGSVRFAGASPPRSLSSRARHGLAFVPEERSIFRQLSTRDNLRVGKCDAQDAVALFPELQPLLRRRAGLLSGGEQQMLAVARALLRRPRILLADELSLGLGPIISTRLLDAIRSYVDGSSSAALLVEQHVTQALRVCDRVIVLERGRIAVQGRVEDIGDRLEKAYLGSAGLEADGLLV